MEGGVGELFTKTDMSAAINGNEAAFRMLMWALSHVENSDVRKLLIEAISLLVMEE